MQANEEDKEDEETMLKRALELSQNVPSGQSNNNEIEEITNLAYQYGFS